MNYHSTFLAELLQIVNSNNGDSTQLPQFVESLRKSSVLKIISTGIKVAIESDLKDADSLLVLGKVSSQKHTTCNAVTMCSSTHLTKGVDREAFHMR